MKDIASGPSAILAEIAEALRPCGIHLRGVAAFAPGEGPLLVGGSPARSMVLLGNIGGSLWPAFSHWRRNYDGPDPLDTFSKEAIRPLAERLGATAFFPSDPPWQPFQQWAMKADGLRPSPLGILIHPRYGLWHGYRGALGFPFEIEAEHEHVGHACDACPDKPCIGHCPVNAVTPDRFDIAASRGYLKSEAGRASCMITGCAARNACPVGADFRYPPEQLRFHMDALL